MAGSRGWLVADRSFVIGCGAGFSADRLDPAVDLARSGLTDTLVFECLGERTLAHAHRDRMADPHGGYNQLLGRRLRALLPVCRETGTRIVTNMGAANPEGAAEEACRIARELGIRGLKVAYLLGDDISKAVCPDWELPETEGSVRDIGLPIVGANAYLGAEHLLPALGTDADVVITGRVADPSLFLAPIAAWYGWTLDDWERIAAGTLVGHLLECGMQVTGGYFADPSFKDVPNLAYCGYPIAIVEPGGSATVTKLETAGGRVSLQTVKEQLVYEVHDPAAYLTPDVTADFSQVSLDEPAPDQVRVSGARGSFRPSRLKATVGFDGGFHGEAGISYAGPGAGERARLAGEIVRERITRFHRLQGRLRIDHIGLGSLHATALGDDDSSSMDVRLHVAFAGRDREDVQTVMWEVESLLCCGPAGGGGFRGQIVPKVVTYSAFVDRSVVSTRVEVLES